MFPQGLAGSANTVPRWRPGHRPTGGETQIGAEAKVRLEEEGWAGRPAGKGLDGRPCR